MVLKVLFTIVVLVICVFIYLNIRQNEHSLGFIIVTGLITTIIGNLLIPSDISIFDIFDHMKEASSEINTSEPETYTHQENAQEDIPEESYSTEDILSSEHDELEDERETIVSELDILPINFVSKEIDNIQDELLDISPVDLNYYKGDIIEDDQIDSYQFVPPLDGRYRFEVMDMLSGVTINIVVLNQAGVKVDETLYGIKNGDGLTINNMVANETYTIQIKQYSSYSAYKILLGLQKSTVHIDNGITQISDSMQYTDQRNIYEFTPALNGRYRFELDEMLSGSEVNMAIYNPGGERIDETLYGIANGDGLTIDNMIAGETYDVFITQYTGSMNYKLLIGYQKETVQLNGETEISDSVQYTAQLNQYLLTPPINGRYRFEISDITSGVEVNMNILNQAGGRVDGTSYGLSKGEGLTIDNMVAGETYTIQIIQYNSYSSYKLKIGYQKESVDLNGNSVSDTMQYTQQQNVYQFSPKSNGDYSFLLNNMVSGMKINISIYNEGSECIDGTSYGIENGNGLLIENMVKSETYTIYITQYEGEGPYLLTIN